MTLEEQKEVELRRLNKIETPIIKSKF